jgi:ribosomal protein S27AE
MAIESIRETGRLPEGIVVDAIGIGTLAYGIVAGRWLPFACSVVLIAIVCMELARAYRQDSRYVCPRCHAVFQPTWKGFLMSGHSPKARKLACPKCGEASWCAEVSVDRTGDAKGATAQ